MNLVLAVLLGAVFGALGRRIAGGWFSAASGFDIGTFGGRAAWAALLAPPLLLAGAGWWTALLAAVFPAGLAIFGNRGMDLGRMGGTLEEAVESLSASGAAMGALAGVASLAAGCGLWAVLPLLAGLFHAPAYWIAWAAKPDIPFLGVHNRPDKGLVDPPPAGELLYGFATGGAMVAAAALGMA